MNRDQSQKRNLALVGSLLMLLMLAGCFGEILIGSKALGFRDAASYYGPMYEWVAEQRLVDDSLYWNGLDNWGGPVLADSTPGIYYPPQMLFLLKPHFPFSVLLGLFATMHVLWAILGTLFCSRKLRLGRAASWMAALSYAFGGALLFQSCNLIFLVSAAWLPWAVAAIIGFSVEGRLVHLPRLAICMAAMILAGDPQMAVHVAMIAGAAWVLFPIAPSGFALGELVSPHGVLSRKLGLAAAVLVVVAAVGLALLQIGPSVEWSSISERAATETNSSLLLDKFARPEAGTHRDAAYQFSLPPWSLAELIWPNALGKMDYGTNVRWSSRLPGSDRIWTGSLYLGVFVFLLAVANFWKRREGRKRRDRIDKFLFGIAALFTVGAFGWYGCGWLLSELQLMRGGVGTGHWLGEPVGGLYWFFECLIPGYSSFRYPAKLFVVGSLFICLAAGRGLDRVLCDSTTIAVATERTAFANFLMKVSWPVIGVSLVLAVVVWLSSLVPAKEVVPALLHSSAVLFVFALCLNGFRKRPAVAKLSILVFLFADLAVANHWLVATVPVAEDVIGSSWIEGGMTVYRSDAVNDYSILPNGNHLPMQLLLDKKSLYPKHHLGQGVRVVGSFHSIQPLDTTVLLDSLNLLSGRKLQNVCEALSIDGQVLPLKASASDQSSTFSLKSFDGRPRFYLTDEWDVIEPINQIDREAVEQQTTGLINWCNEITDDDKNPVWIEAVADELEASFAEFDPVDGGSPEHGSVELVEERNDRIELQVKTAKPMLLVAAEYFHGDWDARIIYQRGGRERELETYRANRLLRGIPIPAGDHLIVLSHIRPNNFRYGWISCLTWVLVLSSMIVLHRRARD